MHDDAWLDAAIFEFFDKPLLERLAKKRRRPWTLYIIQALWDFPDGLTRADTIRRVRYLAQADGRRVSAIEHTIQSAYNHHTSTSSVFRKAADDPCDLFYPVEGKRSGKWALHYDRCHQWMKDRSLTLE